MLAIPDTHTSVPKHFAAGHFVIQQQHLYSFNLTLMDTTNKHPMDKDNKRRGGQIGFSNKANAVHRWILLFN